MSNVGPLCALRVMRRTPPPARRATLPATLAPSKIGRFLGLSHRTVTEGISGKNPVPSHRSSFSPQTLATDSFSPFLVSVCD
jgi:hypothetical protein